MKTRKAAVMVLAWVAVIWFTLVYGMLACLLDGSVC